MEMAIPYFAGMLLGILFATFMWIAWYIRTYHKRTRNKMPSYCIGVQVGDRKIPFIVSNAPSQRHALEKLEEHLYIFFGLDIIKDDLVIAIEEVNEDLFQNMSKVSVSLTYFHAVFERCVLPRYEEEESKD